jgi:hypothetical protein
MDFDDLICDFITSIVVQFFQLLPYRFDVLEASFRIIQ